MTSNAFNDFTASALYLHNALKRANVAEGRAEVIVRLPTRDDHRNVVCELKANLPPHAFQNFDHSAEEFMWAGITFRFEIDR